MENESSCVFCNILENASYDRLVAIHRCVMLTPLNPVVPGHVMFIPLRHAANASEDSVAASLAFRAASDYIFERDLQANIITSIGPDATQTVFHTHIHVVPRFHNDGLTLPWTGQHKD